MPNVHSGAVVFRYRGLKMVGVLNRPAGKSGRRFPAVLFLHGLPGAEKNVDIQRRLLKSGIASFALHFCGAWGSEGYYAFTGLVDEARAGLRFLRSQDFVDSRRLAVFGFSMGGWAAIHLASGRPGLKAVAAVAPVGGPEMVTPNTPKLIAHFSRALRIKSPASLYRDFVVAVCRYDPAESVKSLSCPLLLVHGDADTTVPSIVSQCLFAAAARPKRLVQSKGAFHDFLDRREWLARLVAGWLAKNLKAS